MSDFNYRYLNTSDGLNTTTSTDANSVQTILVDADLIHTTESFGGSKGDRTLSIVLQLAGISGSGTLTFQYSPDNINWYTVQDDSGNNVVITIDNTLNSGVGDALIELNEPNFAFYRFSHASGTISAGRIAYQLIRQ